MNTHSRPVKIKVALLIAVNLLLLPVVAVLSDGLTHGAIELTADYFRDQLQGEGWADNWNYYFLALVLGGNFALLFCVGLISLFNWHCLSHLLEKTQVVRAIQDLAFTQACAVLLGVGVHLRWYLQSAGYL